MGFFSAKSPLSHGKPASHVRADGMKSAAKAAKRGGSGIKVSGGGTKPAQVSSKSGK